MKAKIIDGKAVAARVKNEVKNEAERLRQNGIVPGLAVVLVGDDPASAIYVEGKKKACAQCCIRSFEYVLDKSVNREVLLELVGKLNNDPKVSGILIQSPLPEQIDESEIIAAISPEKDVDAFHARNVGKIMIGKFDFLPCTPSGIMELIADSGIKVEGAGCVVVGRSNIVGKPMAMLLLHKHGTVTICHSRTKDLASLCREADILVAAAGKPKIITADMVKPGAAVIDVGIHRLAAADSNGKKICGDVDFDAVSEVAGYITPVPGGVGPMTIAMLMKNTVTAAKLQSVNH
ncbi:MAG: bifunctional methylenetetrahydrofolate dehydrogenase/methenyltetrahydrofolate cyclohydrolase FolD [Oscillospiraceae bacterium]|nr:bifunctional methylenetetrahydrofolate dehydrogenase/methenyltetrahydrofolate cyclohydrolase FolD [Oscillospiraceae bacterium]